MTIDDDLTLKRVDRVQLHAKTPRFLDETPDTMKISIS
jgi:hypothetical protein